MTTVKVKGMSCKHCVASVTKALEDIPDASDVKVSLEKAEATFQGNVDDQIVEQAIKKIGFEAQVVE